MLNVPAALTQPAAAAPVRAPRAGERWSLFALIDTLRRRIGLILAAVALALALAGAYLAVTPARYTAVAALATDTKRTPPSPNEAVPDTAIDPAVVDSQVEVLRSEKIALAVVSKLRLSEDPEFAGGGPSLLQSALAAIGLREPEEPSTEELDRRRAVAALKRGLKVTRLGRSYVTEIAFTSTDPRRAAAIANEVAEAYIEDQLGAKLQAAQRASTWMQQRTAELRQQAEDAAQALERFKAGHNIATDATGRAVIEREIEEASAALNRARTETAQGRQRVESLGANAASPAAQAAREALAGAQAREDALQQRLAALNQQASGSRQNLATLRDLEGTAQTSRMLYESFLGRFNQTRYTQTVQQQSFPTTEARVITQATPPLVKSAPKSTVVLLLAVLAGGALGAGGAFLRELLDRSLRTGQQLEQDLGVPSLGTLPRMRAGSDAALLSFADGGRRSTAAPVLCGIKVAIDQSAEGAPVVGVTAPRPGAGATTLAYNLALLGAERGRKVLLVDGDLQGRGLSRALAADRPHGLVTLLQGAADLGTSLVRHGKGFDLLPAAAEPLTGHTYDYLNAAAMQALLAGARRTYDYVIVDLPPMLERVDVRAAAAQFDMVILVAEWGRTTADEVEAALRQSTTVADRLLGAVINKAPKA